MIIEGGPPQHTESTTALFRALAIGAAVGALAGAVVGTASWPVVGTFFGTFGGAVVGVLFGLANGLVLAAVVGLSASRRLAAIACGLTTFAAAAAIVAAGYGWSATPGSASNVGLVAACTLVAAGLGPIAGYGARPVRLGRRIGPRQVASVMKAALVIGAAGGAAAGALIGAGIGLATYPPTAPVAAFEGGVLYAVSGAIACLLVATLLIAPKLRVRR